MTELEENGDLVHEASTSVGFGESDMCTDSPLHPNDSDLRNRAKKLEIEGLLKIKFGSSCLSALEELLHDVYVVFRPSSAEYSHRGDLVRYYDAVAREIFGKRKAYVEAYGSFPMDMFSHTSDLDLSINFSSDSVEVPRAEKVKALREFSKWLYILQSKGIISGVSRIMTARVPILKFVVCGTGIECDISVENKDGILKSHFVPIVSEIDERFQKLSSLMKAWANVHGINSSKDGTLNSLSIILLVALHLQTRDPPILPPFSALLKDGTNPGSVKEVAKKYLQYGKENKESLAVLFTSLLSKLASIEVLWREGLCASAYEGSWISKKRGFKIGSISVEDFMDRSQNVARAVRREEVKAIYKCINSSLHQLSEFMEGRIEAPELKLLLFGAETVPAPAKGMKISKRAKQRKKMKQKKATLLNSVAKIESSQIEGFSSEGGVQTVTAIQNQSLESLSGGNSSKKNKKKRPEKATPSNPVSKKKTRQTVAAHIPPEKLPYVIPKLGHGFQNQAPDTIQNHMPPMIAPIPPERPPFIVPGFGHEFHNFSTRLGFNKVGDPTRGPMFNGGGQWERHHSGPVFQDHALAAPVPAEKPSFVIPRFGHDFHKFPTEVREPVEYNGVWDQRLPLHPTINDGEQWGGHPAVQNHPHPVSAPIRFNGPSVPITNGGEQWGGHPAMQNHPQPISAPVSAPIRFNGPSAPTTKGGEQWGGHPAMQNHPHPVSAPIRYHGPSVPTINGGEQWGGHPAMQNHPHPVSAPIRYNGPSAPTTNGGEQWGGHPAMQNHPHPVSAPIRYNGPSGPTTNGGEQWGGHPAMQNHPHPVSAPIRYNGPSVPTTNGGEQYGGHPAMQNHPHPVSAPIRYNGPSVPTTNGREQWGGHPGTRNDLRPISAPIEYNGASNSRGPLYPTTSGGELWGGHETRPMFENRPHPISAPVEYNAGGKYGGQQTGRIFHNHPHLISAQHGPVSETSIGGAEHGGKLTLHSRITRFPFLPQ